MIFAPYKYDDFRFYWRRVTRISKILHNSMVVKWLKIFKLATIELVAVSLLASKFGYMVNVNKIKDIRNHVVTTYLISVNKFSCCPDFSAHNMIWIGHCLNTICTFQICLNLIKLINWINLPHLPAIQVFRS